MSFFGHALQFLSMNMFTSYGHIKKPKYKINTDFLMILAWLCRFKCILKIPTLQFVPYEFNNLILIRIILYLNLIQKLIAL